MSNTTPSIPPASLPRRLGSYVLLEEIGRGAFAQVFRAYRRDGLGGGGFLAIKVVSLARAGAPGQDPARQLRSVINEASIGVELRHNNIARLYDCEQEGGFAFLVMELVEGLPLDRVMRWAVHQGVQLHPGTVLALMDQILDGLAHAHELVDRYGKPRPVVHRDLKPSNVMITWDGVVKVMDFGVSSSSLELLALPDGTTAGTPAFMAPEQVYGREPAPVQDLFSLGSMLYELLSGERLFVAETPRETMRAVAAADVGPQLRRFDKTVSDGVRLGRLLRWVLQRDPRRRPRSARALQRDLRELRRDLRAPTDLGTWASFMGRELGLEPGSTPQRVPTDELDPLTTMTAAVRTGEVPYFSQDFSDLDDDGEPVDAYEEARVFLRRFSMFRDCDRQVLGFLLRAVERLPLSDGEVVFEAGEPGDAWYVVREGVLLVQSKEGVPIARLGPGEVFGEMAVLDRGRRSATVVADGPALVYCMWGQIFAQLKAEGPEHIYPIVRILTGRMCERLRAINQRLVACREDPMRFLEAPALDPDVVARDPSLRAPKGVRRMLEFVRNSEIG